MLKGIAIFFISAFALVANAADSAAIGGPPGLSPPYATEGSACVGVGTQAIDTVGLPLSCQSGRWIRATAFNPSTVSQAQACGDFGRGSFAFNSSGDLYVCK